MPQWHRGSATYHAPQISTAGGHGGPPLPAQWWREWISGFTKTYGFRTSGYQRSTASRLLDHRRIVTRLHGSATWQIHELADSWPRRSVDRPLHGCAALKRHSFAASRIRRITASWHHAFVASRLGGTTASRHHRFAASLRHRITASWRRWSADPGLGNSFASRVTASHHHDFTAPRVHGIAARLLHGPALLESTSPALRASIAAKPSLPSYHCIDRLAITA